MKLRILFLSLASCFLLNANDMAEKVIARSYNESHDGQRMHSRNNAGMQQHKMLRSYITPLRANDGIMFFEGEYLYWKPRAYIPYATTMDILDFGNNAATPDTQREASNVRLRSVNLKRKSGFRATLGFYLPPEGWTTSFQYNYLKRSDTDSASAGSSTTSPTTDSTELNAIWRTVALSGAFADFAKLTDASANQKMSYQVFDWIFNKTFYRKARFALSPYFGVRGAWIRNKLDVLYTGNYNDASDTGQPNRTISDDVRLQNNFRAWGVRGGFAANWMMGWGFEIFGNSSASLVWGKYDMRHREDFISGSGSATTTRTIRGSVTSHNSWRDMKSAIQLALGLNWGTLFANDSMYFGLKVGYEGNYWPNLVQLRKMLRDRISFNNPHLALEGVDVAVLQYFNGDLAVHGLVVGAKFDF